MGRKSLTTDEFIGKSKLKHGDKYDYSLSNYIGAHNKLKIICSEHGIFEQVPSNHVRGAKCPKCSGVGLSRCEIILRFNEIHSDKYDYSLVNHITSTTKLKIICSEHGEFEQHPSEHLRSGCPKCGGSKQLTTDEFIGKSKLKHGDKYGYNKVNYINNKTKVIITCKEHGEFEQTPNNHLNGNGCIKCGMTLLISKKTKSTITFIYDAELIHKKKYDYSDVDYTGTHIKIKIICPEHGEFEQIPSSHLSGSGCPICKESKGERKVRLWLEQKNIKFIPQYKFNDCRNILPLPFDFYLPNYNTCIEFNGLQHYKAIDYFGGEDTFNKLQKRDEIKKDYCYNNDINLIIISNKNNVNIKLNTLM